jgi:cytochrome P450
MFDSEGDAWESQRRFLLRQLRDFGFGKSAMESLIMEEVKEVLSTWQAKSKKGESITEIRETLRLAVVNSLWTILTSKRFAHDDPKLLQLTLNTTKVFNEVIEAGSIILFAPWLRHIFPKWTGYTNVAKVLDENREMFTTAVKEHSAAFDENDLKDFIDVYLAEVKQTTDPNSSFYGEKALRFLAATLFDLFIAGSDTTATTVSWAVLYLSKFPDYQKKLQKEIEQITGNERHVSVNDRPSMPFTLALIDEVLRFSSMVPDGVQHRVMADRDFHGYHIPKDAWVQPNLYYIHHNPKIWGDPEKFRPERFLSADGKKYMRSDNLQAFQIGRRQCVGETLARDSIFLYLTNVFQKFDIGFDSTWKEPSLESDIGFLRNPLPYHVKMTERSK